MKKHLVIMVGGYGKLLSPSGLIMQRLIKEFSDEFAISVIAYKDNDILEDEEVIDGIRVYRIKEYNRLLHSRINNKIKSAKSGIVKKWYSLLLCFKRIVYYIYRLFRSESINKSYVRRLKKKLQFIEGENHIDVLISAVEPHENSAAALLFKINNPDVKWIIYQLDRFANANSLYESPLTKAMKQRRHCIREMTYLEYADSLFALNPISEHYENECFDKYRKKINYTDHPLLVRPEYDVIGGQSDTIQMIYGGSLDKTLRNPYIPLKNIVAASQDCNIKWDIYCFGNCDDIVSEFSKDYPDVIMYHNPVPREELVKETCKSDVLISIGNNSDNEIPSKFFDYLSYGLPIIHFYYSEKDKLIEYLNNYPMALCVRIQDDNDKVVSKEISDFLINTRKQKVNFEIIERKYAECTPKYVSNQLLGEIS